MKHTINTKVNNGKNNKRSSDFIKLLLKILGGLLVLVIGGVLISSTITTVGADEIVVKQDAIDGNLHVWNTSGPHFKNFGTITRYKKSSQYWFSSKEDEGKTTDDSIPVQFNDGAKGSISGSLRYDLPIDEERMIQIHSKYGSMTAISHELVKQVVNKSVYMTAQLISSRESYAEKRADLINFISDQIVHGVYRTERHTVKTIDIISGQEKTVDTVQPKQGVGANGIEREEVSPIETFGMNVYNITINSVAYSDLVEEQIKQQQQAMMAVQQSMVDSRKAEQRAITVAKEGEADAAKAKWAQEVIKATEITKAQQEKDVEVLHAQKAKEVAALDLDTSKLAAQRTITDAKADADAKRMAMAADNALDKKLDAYVNVQRAWATAIGAQRQTPDIQMGGNGSNMSSSQSFVDMMMLKTAKELNVSTK